MTNQLPAPDNDEFSGGPSFDVPGSDMSGVQSFGTNPPNNQLPYNTKDEDGWLFGADMSQMAPMEPEKIPVGSNFGDMSDDGSFTMGDISRSAGFHIIDSFDQMFGSIPGRQQQPTSTHPGPAMHDLLEGSISNQGYPNAGAGAGGIDSMQGLDMGWIPAPFGEQDAGAPGAPNVAPARIEQSETQGLHNSPYAPAGDRAERTEVSPVGWMDSDGR